MSIPHWTLALTQRLRVLLRTTPLFAARQSDGRVDPELRHYDSLVLALRTFDLVVERMGLEHELNAESLARELTPLLEAMDRAADKAPDVSRHERMVTRVVAALRNDDEARRPFEITYPSIENERDVVERRLRFRLLQDRFHPSGGTVFELSTDAVNLYLGALEHDLEDAQAAAEAVVQSQIARGKLEDAAQSARQARWQSLRYAEKVARLLRDTRRDVATVDWREEAPRLLDDSLTHLSSRLQVERNIIEAAGERLDVLSGDDARRAAMAEVIDLVNDCQVRHLELHGTLLGARSVFLEEQARQRFVPAAGRVYPDLGSDVLRPLLDMSRQDALAILRLTGDLFVGAAAPPQLSLRRLVGQLLRPRRPPPPADLDTPVEDLTSRDDDLAFLPQAARVAAVQHLEALETETTLSRVLGDLHAAGSDFATRVATALLALRQFAPDAQTDLPVAARLGSALDAAGFEGDDLRLAPRGHS